LPNMDEDYEGINQQPPPKLVLSGQGVVKRL
jgi:hypothetical protein